MRRTVMYATATVLTGLIVGVYAIFLSGTSRWLISSARGTTAIVLILAISAWALHSLARTQSLSARNVGVPATVLSHVALIAAVIGLITGSPVALAVLVVGATVLWLLTTVRYASTIPGPVHSEEMAAPALAGDKVGAPEARVKMDGFVSSRRLRSPELRSVFIANAQHLGGMITGHVHPDGFQPVPGSTAG